MRRLIHHKFLIDFKLALKKREGFFTTKYFEGLTTIVSVFYKLRLVQGYRFNNFDKVEVFIKYDNIGRPVIKYIDIISKISRLKTISMKDFKFLKQVNMTQLRIVRTRHGVLVSHPAMKSGELIAKII